MVSVRGTRGQRPGGWLAWTYAADCGAYVAGVRAGALVLIRAGRAGGWRLAAVAPERGCDFLDDLPAPLGAQVARAELIAALAGDQLADRRSPWRSRPASTRQLEHLARLDRAAAERAAARGWDAGRVSGAIDVAALRHHLDELWNELHAEAAA